MGMTIALSKGRLAQKSGDLLEQCGLNVQALREDTRKLVLFDEEHDVRFLMVKPSDVPVYVDHGIADIGVVGKDTLLEAALPLYEMLDLNLAKCRLCVAGYEQSKKSFTSDVLRVATKYPRIAKLHYNSKGINIEIIKLNGSIELAPMLGLSDVIVDIVESGKTIVENGLAVLEEICSVSARLVVNRVSLKTKYDEITPLIDNLGQLVQGK